MDRVHVQKKSSQKKFKTPRPDASPAGAKEHPKAEAAQNTSKELSGLTVERGSNAITPGMLSPPGKQDNSGFSFYRLDDSLFVHGSQGNIAQSQESST